MSTVSAWVVCGPSMTQEYDRRKLEESEGNEYSGPMDDRSYGILGSMEDVSGVRRLYDTKEVQGLSPFTLFNLNFPDDQTCIDDLNYLDSEWAGNQTETQGAWYWETGLEMGTSYDEEGIITGAPVYPLNDTTFELMLPPVGATSNDDLQDVNLVWGQNPRLFQQSEVTVLKADGSQGSPARIRPDGRWGPGRVVRLRIDVTNGGNESKEIEFVVPGFISPLDAAYKLAEKIDESVLFKAVVNDTNRVIRIRPEAPSHSFTVTVLQ